MTVGSWHHYSEELVNLNISDKTKIVFEITSKNGEGALAFDNLCLDILSTGISQKTSPLLNLYPNPFTSSTTIELPNNDSHTLSIYDLVGNLVRTEEVSGETINIDRGTLTKGIYFIELRSEKETMKGKVVVE